MPLNIKELHVKMVVSEPETEVAKPLSEAIAPIVDEDALVAKCVAQVFQMLTDQEER